MSILIPVGAQTPLRYLDLKCIRCIRPYKTIHVRPYWTCRIRFRLKIIKLFHILFGRTPLWLSPWLGDGDIEWYFNYFNLIWNCTYLLVHLDNEGKILDEGFALAKGAGDRNYSHILVAYILILWYSLPDLNIQLECVFTRRYQYLNRISPQSSVGHHSLKGTQKAIF